MDTRIATHREKMPYYGEQYQTEEVEDDYDDYDDGEEGNRKEEGEEGEENFAVTEGEVYTTPGVCQPTLKEIILARGSSLLAKEIYNIPDMKKK